MTESRRDLLRQARMAPYVSLLWLPVPPEQTRQALFGAGRGRCAQIAAGLLQKTADPRPRRVAIVWPAPNLARATSLSVTGDSPRGAAAWGGRSADATDSFRQIYAARHPGCPSRTLARLARSPLPHISGAALCNPGCPPVSLLEAAGTKAALREDAPGDVVARHALNDADGAVEAVSAPNCPAKLLASMACQRSQPHIAIKALKHPNCPPGAAAVAAVDADPDVLCYGVGANPNISPEVLARAALAALPAERTEAASNPRCEPWLLAHLAVDTSSKVRAAAAANVACDPRLAKDRSSSW